MRYDAIRRLRPRAEFELTQDGTTNNGEPYLSVYVDPDGQPPPSVAELSAAAAAIDAEREAAQLAAAQLRAQVRTTAVGAVGKVYNTLAAGEVRALLAVLLWRAGALGNDGTVQPLEEWAR